MQTLYFGLMVLAVGWLLLWAALPQSVLDRFWWPFDMKDDAPPPAPSGPAEPAAPAMAGRAGTSWRERARRGVVAAPPAPGRAAHQDARAGAGARLAAPDRPRRRS